MTQWQIDVTTITEQPLTDDQRDALAAALPNFGVLVDNAKTRVLTIHYTVEARTQSDAETAASNAISQAGRAALGEPLPFLGISLARGDKEPAPIGPALVGYIEIAAILGRAKGGDKPLSRQRARQLAEKHPSFPAPYARLATGPVFRLDDVLNFAKTWEGKPGRPRADG